MNTLKVLKPANIYKVQKPTIQSHTRRTITPSSITQDECYGTNHLPRAYFKKV